MRLLARALFVVCLSGTVAAQVDPRTALLERDGFAAIGVGDAHRAAEAFRAALAADPKNARLHLGAGIAAYLERRDADARAALERALTIDPSLGHAREILGQVLRRQGDLAGAIRVYDALIALKPDSTDAAATLDRWRRELELHDRMLQAVGNQFTVSFEGPEEELLATRALESLNRAYWRIGGVLGTYPANPIAVVLYTNEQFHDITRSPAWSAGAYDGTIRVPMRGALDKAGELDRVLAHEFTHALVRTLASRGVPAWLNEGLATALEGDNLSWAEARLREGGRAVTLKGLGTATRSFGQLDSADAQVAYAASAIAVGRLLDEAGGVAIANLLRDLGEGAELEAAFERRMPRSFGAFAESLQ
jgi:tetratricopeptide (TPR) repeat protein